ncbi:hypothetical protein B0A48_09952 [Cryoendolithus antarcticus]|uniref:GTP-binding protein n=1 Tax=Cryoendolithus antarcticus TaxID=1507870 RepID=A0A1V8T367_9PEZI|nr:hypothetical protein B0A48_09952 [Cryoendolithus antarcticus]
MLFGGALVFSGVDLIFGLPDSTMHTLFNPNILSPSPAPAPQPNPFDLLLRTSSHALPASSISAAISASSSYGSSTAYASLTRQQGDQLSESNERSTEPRPYVRRRGHPEILLMGQRSSFTEITFSELPSHIPASSPEIATPQNYASLGAVLWLIDIQDEYLSTLPSLIQTAVFFHTHYPRLHFSVLVHKTDGLSPEYRNDAYREIRQRVQDELSDAGIPEYEIAFHQTSIFDLSIFDAMSKILQRLIPQLPALEALLTRLCSACGMQKAYLFDTASKLYVATDSGPAVLKDYEVCADYVDLIVDIKALYGWQSEAKGRQESDGNGEESIGESVVTFEKSGKAYV